MRNAAGSAAMRSAKASTRVSTICAERSPTCVSLSGPRRRGRSCRCRCRGGGRPSSRSPDCPNRRHAEVRGPHLVDPGEEGQRVRVPVEHGDQRRGPPGRERRRRGSSSRRGAAGPTRACTASNSRPGAGHADDVGADALARRAGRPRPAPRARSRPSPRSSRPGAAAGPAQRVARPATTWRRRRSRAAGSVGHGGERLVDRPGGQPQVRRRAVRAGRAGPARPAASTRRRSRTPARS